MDSSTDSSVGLISGIAGGVAAFFVVGYVFFSPPSLKSTEAGVSHSRESIDSALVKACNQINKNCPMTLDAFTRLDNAAAGSKKITYYYTFIDLPDTAILENQKEIKRLVGNNVHGNPQTTDLLKNGVEMEYIYRNNKGNELFRFSFR
jgi:hypothetical protein